MLLYLLTFCYFLPEFVSPPSKGYREQISPPRLIRRCSSRLALALAHPLQVEGGEDAFDARLFFCSEGQRPACR